jgi:predicted Zn-dependent peptidase
MYPGCLSYPDNVLMNLYGYVSPNNVEKFIDESEKILKDVQKNGIDKDIFECAKTDYLVSVLRRTETSEGKANYLSQKLLYYKEANVEESISKIRLVTIEDCNNIAQEILNKQYNWAVMNPKVG